MNEIKHWSDESIIPAATNSYQPVSHTDLIMLITLELNAQGYSVLTNNVTPAKDGNEITGMMSLRKEGNDDSLPFTYMFGYMNSYNKRLPVKLAAGAYVYICGNGMVVGEIFAYRKHTSGVTADLLELIKNAVGSIEETFKKAIRDTQIMRDVLMTPYEVAELFGVLYIHKQYITSTELNIAVAQYKEPSFSVFTDNSMWSIYNHLTFALKSAPPARRMTALRNVHNFLMDVCCAYNNKLNRNVFTEFDNM